MGTLTSPPYRPAASAAGFSLIEIMIVLGLVGLIVVFFSSRINRNENRTLRKEVRSFAADIRDLRQKARMRNITYRMVINLPENRSEEQTYWVESTQKKFLVSYDEALLKKQKEQLKEGEADPTGFQVDNEISKGGPQKLYEGLFFESVEVAAQKKDFTSGRIYIHFFPEGRVEEAVIHVGNRDKLHWSLAIHPLTGRVDIIDKQIKAAEATSVKPAETQ